MPDMMLAEYGTQVTGLVRRMTLDRGFLTAPYLEGAIADAHLDTRDRMGRLLTFVARIVRDGCDG